MRALFGILLAVALVALLPASCTKKINCKCVGRLYAEDGSSGPATMFVEFQVFPRWVFWSDAKGRATTEMIEPGGWHRIIAYKPLFGSADLEKYELFELGADPARLGIFSSLSGSLGLQTPHGNFVGQCEDYTPIRL